VILVDSSVWIEHLRRHEHDLSALLEAGHVMCHPFVIGEIACGHLSRREYMLAELARLPQAPVASHDEAMGFLSGRALSGRGVGWVDIHLLASTALSQGARLWTKDKRLAAVAGELRLIYSNGTR
jgi:predicted nucleic acid-binding protein